MTPVWARRIVRFRPYHAKNDLLNRGVLPSSVYDRIKNDIIARTLSTIYPSHFTGKQRSVFVPGFIEYFVKYLKVLLHGSAVGCEI